MQVYNDLVYIDHIDLQWLSMVQCSNFRKCYQILARRMHKNERRAREVSRGAGQ